MVSPPPNYLVLPSLLSCNVGAPIRCPQAPPIVMPLPCLLRPGSLNLPPQHRQGQPTTATQHVQEPLLTCYLLLKQTRASTGPSSLDPVLRAPLHLVNAPPSPSPRASITRRLATEPFNQAHMTVPGPSPTCRCRPLALPSPGRLPGTPDPSLITSRSGFSRATSTWTETLANPDHI